MKSLAFTIRAAALAGAASTGLAACASADPTPPAGTRAATAAAITADIDALNQVTGILIDAEALYAEAIELTDNPGLKAELSTLARERGALATRFQTKMQAMGAEPRTKGTALGFGHRIFTDIRSAFDNDDQTAAGEVLRGENYLIEEMQKVLADPAVTSDVKAFVRGAIPSVETDRKRVNDLVLSFRDQG